MEPIENEPKGYAENEESHTTNFGNSPNREGNHREIDTNDNDLAGMAQGNMPDDNERMNRKETNDPRGFMGDFTEPQHDED